MARRNLLTATALSVHTRSDLALVRFAVVGVANTSIDFVLFTLLVYGADLTPPAANVFSYSAGICSSFALNRGWTFKDSSPGRELRYRFVLFFAINIANLVLSTILLSALVQFLPPLVAKVLTIPVVFLINYVASSLIVFQTGRLNLWPRGRLGQ